MECYEPSEQIFHLKDSVIAIDWGSNGDKSVQVTAKKDGNGTVIITDIKVLDTDL